MIDKLNFVLTFVAALGSGLVAGFFFAFSIVVMKALAQQPPALRIAAMQSINIVVINPMFFTAFFGTAAACLVLAVSTFLRRQRPGTAYLLTGSLLYLVGTILVTILFNVPRNNALAAVGPTSVRRECVGHLSEQLDGVEPRAHDRSSGSGRVIYDCPLPATLTKKERDHGSSSNIWNQCLDELCRLGRHCEALRLAVA
jgi:uncharacterized membrane protein